MGLDSVGQGKISSSYQKQVHTQMCFSWEPPGLEHAALLRALHGQAMLQPEANEFSAQVSQAPQWDPAPLLVGSARRAHSHGQALKLQL